MTFTNDQAMRQPLLVTMGDAAGIGPEIVLRALMREDAPAALVLGCPRALRRAAALLGEAAWPIAVLDARTGRFVEFNDAAHHNLGYSRADFAGLSVYELGCPEDAATVTEWLARMNTPAGFVTESRLRHRCGRFCDVRISGRGNRGRYFARQRAVAIFIDIFHAAAP